MITAAIIAARGGSKALPRKNVLPLHGKPLIAWTLEAAAQSCRLNRAIVSTDNDEIAEVARRLGAEVPFVRPSELAQDDTPSTLVLAHGAEWLLANGMKDLTHVLLLQPTSPLRTADDIDCGIKLCEEKNADSVIGVCEVASHPYWIKRMNDQGLLEDFAPHPDVNLARQLLPKAYAPNGSFYLVRVDILLKQKSYYSDNTHGYVMPAARSLDIDTAWDFHLAELILKGREDRYPS